MKRLEEQDIHRLLETPPAAPPPEDLADRLKAQIPDFLPQWDDDEAAASSPDPAPQPLRGPWLPKPWRTAGRLAATLVAMFGVGALSLQLLQWSTSSLESPAAFEVADQTSPAEASPEAMGHADPISEGSISEGSMADDISSESVSAETIPEADVLASDALASDAQLDISSPVVSESRRVIEQSSPVVAESVIAESTTAEPTGAESTDISTALPAPRAKRVEVPSPRAQVDAPFDAASARARRGPDSARESMALRMAQEIEAKRLEVVDVSVPWTLTEAAPRMGWQPSAVDATALEAWRRDPASQDPPFDAALMTFGALSTPRGDAKRLRLDLAPAPSAVLDGIFWLLVEMGPPPLHEGSAEVSSSPRLEIEFSSKTVVRYQLLAGGSDGQAEAGRLLLALQLTPSPGPSLDSVSADDVVVRVRQVSPAMSHRSSQNAVVQEEILRRRDVVPSWHEATWAYRVQTLGMGLVRAFGSSLEVPKTPGTDALHQKAEALATELRQRPASGVDDAQLESWLEWLTSASESNG